MTDTPKLFLSLTLAEYEYLRGLVILGAGMQEIAEGDAPERAAETFAQAALGMGTMIKEASTRLGEPATSRLVRRFFEDGEAAFGNALHWHTKVEAAPDPAMLPRKPKTPRVVQ